MFLQVFSDYFIKILYVYYFAYRNNDAKVLITTGTGKYYSNGIDLDWMVNRTEDQRTQFRHLLNGLLARILTFKLPTIAAVNG